MGESREKRKNGEHLPVPVVPRRVPANRLSELLRLQAEAEEKAAQVRIAQCEAQLALEKFQQALRRELKEQGAPVTYGVNLETGEIQPPIGALPAVTEK
jgi:hypothetical protein